MPDYPDELIQELREAFDSEEGGWVYISSDEAAHALTVVVPLVLRHYADRLAEEPMYRDAADPLRGWADQAEGDR